MLFLFQSEHIPSIQRNSNSKDSIKKKKVLDCYIEIGLGRGTLDLEAMVFPLYTGIHANQKEKKKQQQNNSLNKAK